MSADRIIFCINGTPKSWKAPQFNRKTGNAYKPKQEKVWRESVWGQAMAYAPETPWDGPVRITLMFELPVPKSWPKWKRDWVEEHPFAYPTVKPDWVNVAKALEDALKGIFFIDDRQVAWAQVEKRYAGKDGPGVSVVLERLEGIPDKRPAREQFEGGGDGTE